MRRFYLIAAFLLLVLSGCHGNGIRGYWKNVPLLEDNLRVSEDRMADFAEKAIAAPEEDALAALDLLFNRLKEDPVAYYIYIDWIDGAFYNILSPCRSAGLYAKAVNRMVTDGVLSESDYERFLRHLEWIQYNREGDVATVPGVVIDNQRALVLVLDQGCPSCTEALTSLATAPEWASIRRIAVCCGHGPAPAVPGWEYVTETTATAVFDPQMTPVYFIVSPNGKVESTYQLVF